MSKDIIKIEGLKIFKEKKVKVDDVQINFAEAGKGQPVIIVHGWTNNWKGLAAMGKYLVRKYRVILVDLPGFGDSGRLPDYSLEIEAKYIKRFIEVLDLRKPVVCGHSMGALVVSKFYQMYPAAAKKIVLLAPMMKRHNKEKLMKLTELFYRGVRKTKLTEKILKKIVDTYRYTYVTAKYINMYRFDKNIIRATGIEGKRKVSAKAYVDMGVEVARTNMDDLIQNNRIPVDLIFGKYDRLTNARQAKEQLFNRGNYEIVEVDKAGHILTVEQPELTAKAMMTLMAE